MDESPSRSFSLVVLSGICAALALVAGLAGCQSSAEDLSLAAGQKTSILATPAGLSVPSPQPSATKPAPKRTPTRAPSPQPSATIPAPTRTPTPANKPGLQLSPLPTGVQNQLGQALSAAQTATAGVPLTATAIEVARQQTMTAAITGQKPNTQGLGVVLTPTRGPTVPSFNYSGGLGALQDAANSANSSVDPNCAAAALYAATHQVDIVDALTALFSGGTPTPVACP